MILALTGYCYGRSRQLHHLPRMPFEPHHPEVAPQPSQEGPTEKGKRTQESCWESGPQRWGIEWCQRSRGRGWLCGLCRCRYIKLISSWDSQAPHMTLQCAKQSSISVYSHRGLLFPAGRPADALLLRNTKGRSACWKIRRSNRSDRAGIDLRRPPPLYPRLPRSLRLIHRGKSPNFHPQPPHPNPQRLYLLRNSATPSLVDDPRLRVWDLRQRMDKLVIPPPDSEIRACQGPQEGMAWRVGTE